MTNKEKYIKFCEQCYVQIYSQPWWMDAICLPENWDVWLYETNNETFAAMPYYREMRGSYQYITKPPLTQNNGIIFRYPAGISDIKKQSFEEKVIEKACEFIKGMGLDVYEQQFPYTFNNYLPFYWNNYQAIPRYTFVISEKFDKQEVWNGLSSKYRKNIKKGNRNGHYSEDIGMEEFYMHHEKVFLKQGRQCPFSFELWKRLYSECTNREQGKIMCYKDDTGNILSLLFLVWDEKSMYHLLGGSMPEFQKLETYNALTWDAIMQSRKRGLLYDFEGSMIRNISKSFREFGGEPKLYFRIRKVFNSEILKLECTEKCRELEEEVGI